MKYYIDTSSLVKIYHSESGSQNVHKIYYSKIEILISELAIIEFLSTVCRKYREHEITLDTLNALVQKFQEDLNNRYKVLKFSSLIIEEAWNLLYRFAREYSFTTLDSLQFAFFKTYCEEDTKFVCSDKILIKVADREGAEVFVP